MSGWRCHFSALSVIALFTCACAISSRRSAETQLYDDLLSNGFSIACRIDGESGSGPIVTVTDAESTDRLIQWFRHRPKSSGWKESVLSQGLEGIEQEMPVQPTFEIKTTRMRVKMTLFAVALETRSSSVESWTKNSWVLRKEDAELQQWISSRIETELERIAPVIRERGMMGDESELDWTQVNEMLKSDAEHAN